MGILDFIGGIFKPAADLIDNLHTSEEEKLQLQKEIQRIQTDFQGKVLEYETKLMDAQSSVIKAEATSASWIARNWRPITMLTFLVLVVLDSFGLLALEEGLPDQAWILLQIGLGGYVVGRSAKKIVGKLPKGKPEEAKG